MSSLCRYCAWPLKLWKFWMPPVVHVPRPLRVRTSLAVRFLSQDPKAEMMLRPVSLVSFSKVSLTRDVPIRKVWSGFPYFLHVVAVGLVLFLAAYGLRRRVFLAG